MAYAETLGIDPEAYWKGVQQVKVVSHEKVEAAALLLEFMGKEIATMALANLKLKIEIDARKKAEEALNQRNRELLDAQKELETHLQFTQTLLETIPAPVFYKDVNGRYQGCNRSFERFLGKRRDDFIGATVYEMAPKEIAQRYELEDQELFRSPGQQIYEWKLPNAKGELRDVIFNKGTFRNEDDEIAGLIGVITDITEIKAKERALKESESRFRLLFEHAKDAIFLTDSTSRFIMVNRQACTTLGYGREELLTMSIPDVEVGNSEADFQKTYEKLEKEKSARKWGMHRRKDGSTFPVEVTICSYVDQDALYLLGIARDMSEQKRAENEREALIENLQKALSEIKQLSGLIPICSSCKKIRNDEGFWDQVEAYISKHSDVHFTHGICPGCMKRLYGDEDWFDDAFERELHDEFERTLHGNGEGRE